MSKETNIEAQKKMGEAINKGTLEKLREVMASDVKDHDPAPQQGEGVDGFIKFFTEFRTAFPDLSIAVEDLVADEEQVAFAYTITGTHNGNFLGIPPSGKKIKARGMQISKFKDGKIVERWGSSDELGIMQQIGVVKPVKSVDEPPILSGQRAS
jgi:Predicted ester cyclase